MQVIMLGPIMLKYSLLMTMIAVATGYLVILFWTRHLEAAVRKPLMDDLMVMLLIGILVWKFSPLIFDTMAVIQSPLYLLYYTGGTQGILLAIIVCILLLAYQCFKHRKPWIVYVNTMLTWLIAAYGILNLLRVILENGGYPAIGTAVVAAAVVTYQFRHRERIFSSYLLVCTLMWSAIGLFTVSLVDQTVEVFWLGLGKMQLVQLLVAILSLIMKVILEKRESQNT